MSFVAAAIIGGVGVVGGAYLASQGAQSAATTQANAANNAAQMQQSEFNTINQQQQPWLQAGQTALGQLTAGTAPGGQFSQQFTNADLNANLAPNYQFMLNQGLGQAQNQFNASGGLVGGNALQGLNTFAQNYAQNAYQNAFNNWQSQQTNIYNRLANIAGLGQTSANTLAQSGTQLTGQAANYLTSGAAAQAAGQVGSANAISSGLQGLGNSYLLGSLLGSGAGSGIQTGGVGMPGA